MGERVFDRNCHHGEGYEHNQDSCQIKSLESLPSLNGSSDGKDRNAFNFQWTLDSLPSIDADLLLGPASQPIRSLDSLPSNCFNERGVCTLDDQNLVWESCNTRSTADPYEIPGVQEVHAMLGAGYFAETYHCSFKDQHEQVVDVALKVFDQQFRIEDTQAHLMAQLTHPNLVRLYTVIDSMPCGLVLEFFPAGSLKAFLQWLSDHESAQSYDVQTRLHGARNISAALQYLHSIGVVHRDVQTRNCFLTQKAQNGILPTLKLGELGPTHMTHNSGFVDYISLDVVNRRAHDASTDILSFGMLLWELLSGKEVRGGHDCENAGQAGAWPSVEVFSTFKLRAEICNLIGQCYDQPACRISASNLTSQIESLIPFA